MEAATRAFSPDRTMPYNRSDEKDEKWKKFEHLIRMLSANDLKTYDWSDEKLAWRDCCNSGPEEHTEKYYEDKGPLRSGQYSYGTVAFCTPFKYGPAYNAAVTEYKKYNKLNTKSAERAAQAANDAYAAVIKALKEIEDEKVLMEPNFSAERRNGRRRQAALYCAHTLLTMYFHHEWDALTRHTRSINTWVAGAAIQHVLDSADKMRHYKRRYSCDEKEWTRLREFWHGLKVQADQWLIKVMDESLIPEEVEQIQAVLMRMGYSFAQFESDLQILGPEKFIHSVGEFETMQQQATFTKFVKQVAQLRTRPIQQTGSTATAKSTTGTLPGQKGQVIFSNGSKWAILVAGWSKEIQKIGWRTYSDDFNNDREEGDTWELEYQAQAQKSSHAIIIECPHYQQSKYCRRERAYLESREKDGNIKILRLDETDAEAPKDFQKILEWIHETACLSSSSSLWS